MGEREHSDDWQTNSEMNVSFVVLHYRHYNSVCHDIIDNFLKEHTRDAVREVTRTVQKELSDIGIDVSDEAMLKCVDNLDMNKNEIFNAIGSDEGNAFTKKHFPFKSWGADKVSLREYDRQYAHDILFWKYATKHIGSVSMP